MSLFYCVRVHFEHTTVDQPLLIRNHTCLRQGKQLMETMPVYSVVWLVVYIFMCNALLQKKRLFHGGGIYFQML